MASKINSLSGAPAPAGAGHRADKARDATGGSSAPVESRTSDVHITDSASLLAGLAQQLRNVPAVDELRVAQFRTAIENGSYAVQPQHVADQLMQIEYSLAQSTAG